MRLFLLGDHRSICAGLLKAEGVVIDGAFRDLEGCEESGFPVYAKGLTCGTAAKSGAGSINVPVSCGGVSVKPGDIVIGDVNGVCVISQEEAEAVIERALKKIEIQQYTLAEMNHTGKVFTKMLKK